MTHPPGHDNAVEAAETDSAIGDDTSSVTRTLDSEATRYEFENGRRYHSYKAGSIQHHIWLEKLDGKLQAAPISEDVQDVLDIGTGTGNWAIDFADEYPSARVIGVDLSPIQPTWVPPNCFFEVDDCEADWTYNHKFDFIHGRMLTIGWRNWDKLCEQAFDYLNPGGWFELQEFAFPLTCECPPDTHPEPLPCEYFRLVKEAAEKRGVKLQDPDIMAERLKAFGFTNVHTDRHKWMLSDPKVKRNALTGLEGIAMSLYTKQLGWSREEVLVYIAGVRKAIKADKPDHLSFPT
ncbi:MAG: hypothetical protein M1834_009336 [Cirrosporium novae-zelandiae]|nr:MAG: hypothetical protein M1834_009336 [Cirrosporium novae-zelandiae]